MRVRLALLPLGLLLLGQRSEAAPPGPLPTKLVYTRAPGAEVCPDEAWLRDAIGARLGYAPFADEASRTVVVKIVRAGKGVRATIDLVDATGRQQGSRAVDSDASDCVELASSIALDVSMAIDPVHAMGAPTIAPTPPAPPTLPAPPTPPKQEPPPAPALPAPEQRPMPPLVVSREPITMIVAAGPLVATGTAPGVSFGANVQVGVRWRAFSVAIEGRADLPASAAAWNGARVESSLLTVSLLPCAHFGVGYGCVIGSLGSLAATATEVARAQREWTLFAAVGLRGGVEWRFAKQLGVQAHVDVLAPLISTTLLIDGRDAWTTSPVSLAGGLALAGHFP